MPSGSGMETEEWVVAVGVCCDLQRMGEGLVQILRNLGVKNVRLWGGESGKRNAERDLGAMDDR